MSDAANRILIAILMLLVLIIAVWLNGAGFNGIYWLSMGIILAMIFEYIICLWCAPRDVMFDSNNLLVFLLFGGLLGIDLLATSTIARNPTVLLILLLAICGADTCAWFFGKQIGGAKLWEKLSANKTWAGQIFGIIGGTAAAVIGGYVITKSFIPQLVWIGISLSLLSQYGDLTASFVKRRLKIKDFSRVLGAHGGILDRFDSWMYVLPVVWIVMKLAQ